MSEKEKTFQIIEGDALTKLKEMPDESVDCCITSPPYWALRDYGTAKWEGGNPNCDHIQQYNSMQSSKSTLGGRNTEQTLNDKRRDMHTQYKDKCEKCNAVRKDKQLGLEPTFQEYINKLCDIFDEVKRVLKKEGTCWVNMGDTYGGSGGNHKEHHNNDSGFQGKVGVRCGGKGTQNAESKCLLQIPSRFAIEMCNRGWTLRNEIIWHKPNCMPSSVKDRFTVDFEKIFFFVKSKRYYFETQYESQVDAEKSIRQILLDKDKQRKHKENSISKYYLNTQTEEEIIERANRGRNKRCVFQINAGYMRLRKDLTFATKQNIINEMIKRGLL